MDRSRYRLGGSRVRTWAVDNSIQHLDKIQMQAVLTVGHLNSLKEDRWEDMEDSQVLEISMEVNTALQRREWIWVDLHLDLANNRECLPVWVMRITGRVAESILEAY